MKKKWPGDLQGQSPGPLEIQVSEDRLTARLNRIDARTSREAINALLRHHGICYGIDTEAIEGALSRADQGQIQYGVAVARGTPLQVFEPAAIEYREGIEATAHAFERLQKLFVSPTADGLSGWSERAVLVRQGEVLAKLVPARFEAGRDVFGKEMVADPRYSATFRAGEHVVLSDDGSRYLAAVYGCAGLLDGALTVVPPLWVAADRMEACFVCLSSVDPSPPLPTTEDIHRLLDLQQIHYRVHEERLVQIHQSLERDLFLPVVIAAGLAPVHGEHAQIQYLCDLDELLTWSQLYSLRSATTLQALKAELEEIAAAAAGPHPLSRAVRRDDLLAEKIAATEGFPGRDIEGREILPEEGRDVALQVGDQVVPTLDGFRYTAAVFGYVCLRLDQLEVVSPLWIAPDRTAAYFLNLPQGPNPVYPRLGDMEDLLQHVGIRHGFNAEQWQEVVHALEAGQRRDLLIEVATATLVQPGRDAEFSWAIDIEAHEAGTILEDGSIDFRERNLVTAVEEGDLLGVLVPEILGTPGIDVLGGEIRPPLQAGIEVVADAQIYARTTDKGTAYYAETSGGVTHQIEYRKGRYRNHKRLRLGIFPISTIAGDVDFSTGNIDFIGSVIIAASVQPLFSVKATGSVSIGGYVEAGASISAGEDILVRGGIVGANTTLVAGGTVMAKFVQEATIKAAGDVRVGAYIFNASVRTQGKVEVVGRGEGKARALVGGMVWAGSGIVARSIGSPYNSGTKLVVGIDPEQTNRLDQLHANMASCAVRQQGLMQQLSLEALDVELLKARLQRASSAQAKKAIIMGIKKIARLAEMQRDLEREIEELFEAQRALSRRVRIEIQHTLFAGVEIRIGEASVSVSQDLERVCCGLEEDGESSRVEIETLL